MHETSYHPPKEPLLDGELSTEALKAAFGESGDVSSIHILVGGNENLPADILFIDGLASGQWIAHEIVRPLAQAEPLAKAKNWDQAMAAMQDGTVHNHDWKTVETLDDAAGAMISGRAVVLPMGTRSAVSYEAKGFPSRGVSEPTGENVIKGAKDSFVENLRVNTALLRRKIGTPMLRFQEFPVGRQSKTNISICYIEGLTQSDLVSELRRRLDELDVDSVILAAQIEEALFDKNNTTFPQLLYTERSDRLASAVVDGRVGLLIDGMPLGYILPATFADMMKAPEDMARNYILASFVLLMRYAAFAVTLLLPALYLSIITFHQKMIPTALAQAIVESKNKIPYSSVTEVIFMLLAFEILIEAGLRMPQNIGPALSIVGGLVVGQAAVEANLVSPAVVIVIAFAGISSFVLPNQDFGLAIRLWRLLMVIGAALLGLFGVTAICVLLLYHMCCIESFGVAYFANFSLQTTQDMFRRALLRWPVSGVKTRQSMLRAENVRNQK